MPNTITTNMGLVVPTVGLEPGPTWANDINADLGILDQHNHTSGQGVPIPTAGININADLPFNGSNAISLKTVNFTAQSGSLAGAAPNLGCIYVGGRELYYNDEVGNVVQITSGGSVNAGAGSITGLPSGTASASYSGGTFIWQSATSTPANMDAGAYIFRNNSANSKGLTVSPPNAMAADYALVWPALPASPRVLTLDTSGNITPSGVSGTGTTQADVLPSLGLVPSGSILPFGGASAPAGYLLCDGTSYLRATYANLFTAISTAYGTADGTHFNVPDLRGMFLRGVTGASVNDPDASSRTAQNTGGNTGNNVGSQQGYGVQSHVHNALTSSSAGSYSSGTPIVSGAQNAAPITGINTFNTNGATGDTRPINVYVNYIIKT